MNVTAGNPQVGTGLSPSPGQAHQGWGDFVPETRGTTGGRPHRNVAISNFRCLTR
jgi:hypothetical protein